MTNLKQGDWVYAWNNKTPHKKAKTRFLHTMEWVTPANICVNPGTLDGYPKSINTIRYDMIVPCTEDSPEPINTKPKATVPEQQPTSEVPFGTPNYRWHIMLMFFLIMGTWTYIALTQQSSSITDNLLDRTHDIQQKVNELEVKVRDDSDQLASIVEDYYSDEYNEAREIARAEWYIRFYHFVSVRDGRIVRLADSSGYEIEVNIVSKSITRFE